MNVSEYYSVILTEVVRATGMSARDVLCDNSEKGRNARYVLVYFCGKRLSDGEIAEQAGMSRQRVNWLRNHFDIDRAKWSVREVVKGIEGRLEGK